jgi:hypothetical protein
MTTEYECPECKAQGINVIFKDPRGLGSHRRGKHGIVGMSPSVVSSRKTKRKAVHLDGIFKCPECKAQGVRAVFTTKTGLGIHRRSTHGIPGSSSAAISARRNHPPTLEGIVKQESLKCFYCAKTFKGTLWREKHINLAHPGLSTTEPSKGTLNGNGVESKENQAKRDYTIYSAGYLEGIGRGLADAENLPAKEFIAGCAEYLFAITRR